MVNNDVRTQHRRYGVIAPRGAVVVVAVFATVALLLAGCATSTPHRPRTTVTVYSSAAAGSVVSSAVSPSPRASTSALAASFRLVAAGTGLTVGVAVAPVGRSARATLVLGDRTPGVAWSTIKVPLAVAAERANGRSAAESDAIINSDNAAAEQLWASLGSASEASQKVTAVLREAGDATTTVPATQLRAGFTVFGQTQWTLPAAAAFTAHLPCLSGTAHVISLMGQVAGNQQWGVEIMATPRSTAVKGGWGPGADGSYLVRQLGLITFADGRRSAVAMSAVGGSMSAGIAALNAVANWLNKNAAVLPRGSCR